MANVPQTVWQVRYSVPNSSCCASALPYFSSWCLLAFVEPTFASSSNFINNVVLSWSWMPVEGKSLVSPEIRPMLRAQLFSWIVRVLFRENVLRSLLTMCCGGRCDSFCGRNTSQTRSANIEWTGRLWRRHS